MDDELMCTICCERYSERIRPPMTLKCGHTFCGVCLKTWYEEKARIQCPLDEQMFYEDVESLPKNYAVLQMLQRMEVRCPIHTARIVSQFCLRHFCVLCPECTHEDLGCETKAIMENSVEVANAVYIKLREISGKTGVENLPIELKTKLEIMYKRTIGENISLLYEMFYLCASQTHLVCAKCGNCESLVLSQSSMESYCRGCVTPGTQDTFIDLSGRSDQDTSLLLAFFIPNLLKVCNFSDLTYEQIWFLYNLSTQTAKDIQAFCILIRQHSGPRATFDTLPELFYCLECFRPQYKANCWMRILPCCMLHAICELCAQSKSQELTVTCPLDKLSYFVRATDLEYLCNPYFYQVSDSRAQSSCSQNGYDPRWAPSQVVSSNSAPAQSYGIIESQNPKPSQHPESRTPPCTQLQQFPPPAGFQFLERFSSVVPCTSMRLSDRESKGWFVNFDKNQVEAVSFIVTGKVAIFGLGLGCPADPGNLIVLESVAIYPGIDACGRPAFLHSPDELLVCSDCPIHDIYFEAPYVVKASELQTMKVKFVRGPGRTEKAVCLYRGNPFERPDVWVGSDALIWDFSHVGKADVGEFISGQNNLSGPILRIYYRSA